MNDADEKRERVRINRFIFRSQGDPREQTMDCLEQLCTLTRRNVEVLLIVMER